MDEIINNLIKSTSGFNKINDELLSLCGEYIFYIYISVKYEKDIEELKKKYPNDLIKVEDEKPTLKYKGLDDITVFNVSGEKIGDKITDYIIKIKRIVRQNEELENYLHSDLNDTQKEILGMIISNIDPKIFNRDKIEDELTTFLNKLLDRLSEGISITDNLMTFLRKFTYDKNEIKSVYDNAVGLGNLFDKNPKRKYYGIEIDPTIQKLCDIIMRIYEIENFTIECGNSLVCGIENQEEYDLVFSDMPMGIRFNTDLIDKNDERYKGVPETLWKSDGLFIADALHHLKKEKSLCVVTCTQGLLFRPGGERDFREYLIEKNFIEAILYLPQKVLKGANDPISFMILKKDRTDDYIKLFELSEFFDEGSRGKPKEISPDNMERIIDIYYNEEYNDKFVKISKGEIKEKNYDLSYSMYIESKYDLKFDKESKEKELKELREQSTKNKKELEKVIEQL